MTNVSNHDPLNFVERWLKYRVGPLKVLTKLVLFFCRIELPSSVKIGESLRLPHGAFGLVVHPSTIIGNRVKLYQGVTLGRADVHLPRSQVRAGGGIIIEDDALIAAGAKVLFKGGTTVVIGKGAVVAANAVVVSSIPSMEIWGGIPAKKIGQVESTEV